MKPIALINHFRPQINYKLLSLAKQHLTLSHRGEGADPAAMPPLLNSCLLPHTITEVKLHIIMLTNLEYIIAQLF